jgi:hypothetical protein
MRLNATRLGSIASSRSFGDQLDDLAGQVPSLDLNFAQNKSLIDDYSGTTPVTHTRASSGTYVDSDGVLRSAVTNLFTHSESISSGWGISNTSITSDAIASPVGTITADLATNTGGNDSISRVATVGSSATVAFSLYMKRSNIDWVRLTFLNGANEVQAWFNLSTGTIGTVNATGTATSASASIQNIGNGWYRCVLVGAIPGQTSYTFFNTTAAADASFTRVTGGERYLWGAQLEQSTTVGEYVPTTGTINSAPRFDHDPTTGESLGLLVEEARTNLILQSENLSTTWTNVNTSEAINVATAPDGTTTADKLITNNGVASVSSYITQTVAKSAAATTYTYSVFAKTGDTGTGTVQLLAVDTASSANRATSIFSTVSGTIVNAASVNGTFTNASSIITPLADGWYRFSLTFTTGTETSINLRLYSRLPTTGNGSSGLLLWGAQLEAGAFATSYIPTVAATVTRAADISTSVATSVFENSWYRQDEGTVFVEASPKANAAFVGFNDGTTSNRIRLAHTGTTAALAVNVTGGALQFSINSGVASFPLNTQGKAALAMKASDFALVGNTSSVVTSTGLMPSINQATIGSSIGTTTFVNGTIKRLTYFPTRLGNEVLQRITQ